MDTFFKLLNFRDDQTDIAAETQNAGQYPFGRAPAIDVWKVQTDGHGTSTYSSARLKTAGGYRASFSCKSDGRTPI